MKGLSVLVLALALCLGSVGGAAETAAPLGPLALVESSVARVIAIMRARPVGSGARHTEMRRVTDELFDFRELGRRALGPHWKSLSPPEQHDFVRLFTGVLERALVASLDGYTNEHVTFVDEEIKGPWARVRSRIVTTQGAAIGVEYRLFSAGARWAVYDVIWDRVSLVAHHRTRLGSVIRASSVAQLLERMRSEEPRRDGRS